MYTIFVNVFKSENQLDTSMINYSLINCDSTLGENIRYLMHRPLSINFICTNCTDLSIV